MFDELKHDFPQMHVSRRSSRNTHGCAGAVEVDIGDNKKQMFVGSVASRRAHDIDMDQEEEQVSVGSVEHEGNGNGIGTFAGHVPLGSRIDTSESEVCRDQDIGSFVEGAVERHDVGSVDKSNVRGSDPSPSRRQRQPRLPKHKRSAIRFLRSSHPPRSLRGFRPWQVVHPMIPSRRLKRQSPR